MCPRGGGLTGPPSQVDRGVMVATYHEVTPLAGVLPLAEGQFGFHCPGGAWAFDIRGHPGEKVCTPLTRTRLHNPLMGVVLLGWLTELR